MKTADEMFRKIGYYKSENESFDGGTVYVKPGPVKELVVGITKYGECGMAVRRTGSKNFKWQAMMFPEVALSCAQLIREMGCVE